MKITIATTTGFHLRHLARELISVGEDVTYFTYAPEFRIRRDEIPLHNAQSLFWRLQPWSTLAQFRHLPELQRAAVIKMLALTDRATTRALAPCDVFIGLSSMSVESAAAARARGAVVVVDRGARHVLSQDAILREADARPLSPTYIARELESYQVADYIALPSTHSVESFLEQGVPRSKLFYNPYGVDTSLFQPGGAKKDPLRIIFVGAWSRQKGADLLTAALDLLPDAYLSHAGMVADAFYPQSPRFTALGHLDHRALAQALREHHVLVLPSRQDGFGMVLLEALASGLGVVASPFTGARDVREAIENPEFVSITQTQTSAELAAAIQAMGDKVIAASSRKFLTDSDREHFSWRGYAQRYLSWLKALRRY